MAIFNCITVMNLIRTQFENNYFCFIFYLMPFDFDSPYTLFSLSLLWVLWFILLLYYRNLLLRNAGHIISSRILVETLVFVVCLTTFYLEIDNHIDGGDKSFGKLNLCRGITTTLS